MKRLIMTGCLAVALAFGPQNAAPAKAFEGEEILGIVLGLAALAALSQEFNRDDDKKGHKYRPHSQGQKYGHSKYRPNSYRPHHYALPGRCVTQVRTSRGTRSVLGERCLRDANYRISALPRNCRFSFRTRHGVRYGYSAYCLRQAGFAIGAATHHKRK